MKLTSSAFGHEQPIPARHTCDGADVSPSLLAEDLPTATQSLALIMDDPDSRPTTWLHWLLWNVPAATAEVPEGVVPAGAAQGMTDFGRVGYGGPCPSTGNHRYFFKLYALDTVLPLEAGATKAALEAAMEGHVIAETQLMGTYTRT